MRKYIDIINEMNDFNEINRTGKMSQQEAGYVSRTASSSRCYSCTYFIVPNTCELVEGMISPEGWCKYYKQGTLEEKWGTSTTVSPSEKGKYEGKTKEELLKSYRALKASGPHSKGSPEFGRMRELAFAIRAKSGWGGVE